MTVSSEDIIQFWFEEISPKQRWTKDKDFDRMIEDKYGETLKAANQCELFHWRKDPMGRLAEIIVLDQFSRNIFRDRPEAFASDSLALCLSQELVALQWDQKIPIEQRSFAYMPYMHSESPSIHEEAVKLFSQEGMSGSLDFEIKHKVIIDRFGRYPHRNAILGRESTSEEIEFLKEKNSSF